jgi:acyl carrier protein
MTQNGTPELKLKLVEIISAIVGVPPEAVSGDFSSENCGEWDSVRHLMLVLTIEDNFAITFDETEIWSLQSLPALTKAVEARLAA